MSKILYATILAAGLALAPMPALTHGAAAQTAAVAATKVKAKPKRPPTPGQIAARDRQKKCGAEWRAAKAAGKIKTEMKWPQYWSACNRRLRSGG